ncbi:MAG: DUF1292 domain-containing protein [Bacilli bacterium]|nr:DUF1292 domain-containing protein [Bacilli bacterium]
MEEKQTIMVLDQNGKEREAEILTSFKLDAFNKEYILYTFNEVDENDMIKIYASVIAGTDGMYSFEAIETDEEWTAIKEIMKQISQVQ